jgi:transposase InsO family protein
MFLPPLLVALGPAELTHTYNTLRPHQALDERTPRAAYLALEHCD